MVYTQDGAGGAGVLAGLGAVCAGVLGEHGCPSVSVAVAERGEVVLAEAFGFADVAAGRAASPQTAYALASISKPFTATAVCVAVDEGLIGLDEPVPVAGDSPWGEPTVRQLLRHRGGFGMHYDFHHGADEPAVDAERYARLRRAPGSGYEYANLGFRALGRLLEKAGGQPLGSFVRERVFEPLGLRNCLLAPAYPGPAPSAVRYTVDGRPYPRVMGTSHPGATLGWAPAPELALFGQSYARLLKPATVAAMRDGVPINAQLGYGLGWCVSYGDGPSVISHGGGMGGVAAMLVTVPDRELSVAVLTNSTNKAARDAVVQYVMSALVPDYRPELISPLTQDPARPAELPPGVWSGRIVAPERDIPTEVRVLPDGGVEASVDGERVTGPADASAEWDLRADLPLQLPTADARLGGPRLGLALRLDGAGRELTGVAYAYKNGDAEGLMGNFLSHSCELTRR